MAITTQLRKSAEWKIHKSNFNLLRLSIESSNDALNTYQQWENMFNFLTKTENTCSATAIFERLSYLFY